MNAEHIASGTCLGEQAWLELDDFVQAVREKRAPRVDGRQGRTALALAQRITEAMAGGQ